MIGVLAIFVSCDKLNELPEFNEDNAFVAFNSASVTVKENAGQLKIPVTLASVAGKSASVTYTVVDGTAKQNTNFTLADPTATLNFDAENRTQYIVINITNIANVYTGDLKFQIQLSDEGVVRPNNEWLCNVTINDIDHPLAALLGEWTATATSNYFGAKSWSIKIEKDAKDPAIVWIADIVYGFPNYGFGYPGYDNRYSATVNAAKTEMTINFGQKCAFQYSSGGVNYDIFLYGLSADLKISETGKAIGTISPDNTQITLNTGLYVTDATGYWDGLLPGIKWTKKK